MNGFLTFIINFGFNFLVALILVRWIYYPKTQNKRYVFTFLSFNTIIYFVLSFMNSIELSVGVGFGLFAIFSVLRYRTDEIPIREMTYLFIIAAIPVMNSIGLSQDDWLKLILANTIILLVLFILEREWGFRYEVSKRITYEKIELIKPENRVLLLDDLVRRTGLPIKRVAVGRVNFLRDTAEIKIYYDDPEEESWINIPDSGMQDFEDEEYLVEMP